MGIYPAGSRIVNFGIQVYENNNYFYQDNQSNIRRAVVLNMLRIFAVSPPTPFYLCSPQVIIEELLNMAVTANTRFNQ